MEAYAYLPDMLVHVKAQQRAPSQEAAAHPAAPASCCESFSCLLSAAVSVSVYSPQWVNVEQGRLQLCQLDGGDSH